MLWCSSPDSKLRVKVLRPMIWLQIYFGCSPCHIKCCYLSWRGRKGKLFLNQSKVWDTCFRVTLQNNQCFLWKLSRLAFIYYPAFLPSQFLSAVSWLALPGCHHLLAKFVLKDSSWLGGPFRVDNFSLLCRLWSSSSVAWNLTSRTGTSSRTASCRALLYGLRGQGKKKKRILPSPSVRASL